MSKEEYDEDLKRSAPCIVCPVGFEKKATHISVTNRPGTTIIQQVCSGCVAQLVLHRANLDDTEFYEK